MEKNEEIINLNVGGSYFTTTRKTLSKSPFFEALLSGKYSINKDTKGRIFIDRPSHQFKVILSWLQTGYLEVPEKESKRNNLENEIDFYMLKEDAINIFIENKCSQNLNFLTEESL